MIEWNTAPNTTVEIIPAGEVIGGYPEPVGDPDRPDVIALGIFGAGEGGCIIDGTPEELREFIARAAAALDAHEASQTKQR